MLNRGPHGGDARFLGPNGAGKSTTIRVLVGLLRADAGVVRCSTGTPGATPRCCTVGWLPGLVRVAWAFAAFCLVLGWLGGLLHTPAWISELTPYQHTPGRRDLRFLVP